MKKAFALLALIPILVLGLSWDRLGRALGRRDLDPAVISASLQVKQEPPITLRPDAAAALSAWLTHHSKGWGKILYTPPLCDRWVTLTYGDGKTVSLALYPETIIASRVRSGGLMVKPIPPDEIAQLLSFFGPQ